MSNSQTLYPTLIQNPQSTKNANVQVSDLTAGSLSRTLDLQSVKVVKGYVSPTAIASYFVYDVLTGLPIQLQQGDSVLSYAVYGPVAATGGTAANGVALSLNQTPTFDDDGVASTPNTAGTPVALVAASTATVAAVTTGLVVGIGAGAGGPNVVGSTYQWLTATTSCEYVSGTISVTLLVMNNNLQEIYP